MKSIGCVRAVDDLGRITLPIELRRTLEIDVKDSLEIFVDGRNIVLRKYTPGCSHCGFVGIAAELGSIKLCAECRGKLVV